MPLTIEELRARLDREGVRRDLVSLGTAQDDAYCIVETPADWQVFSCERGNKINLTRFPTFTDAAGYFLELVLSDPTTRA